MDVPNHGLQITSTLIAERTLELELTDVPVIPPADDDVVVRIEAAPLNPADLLTMLPSVDLSEARFDGTGERRRVTVPVSPEVRRAMAGRVGLRLPVGLEGAGVVVATGENAKALLGKKIAVLTLSAGTFAQYRTVRAAECIELPQGITTEQGASMFVNPLTALAIVETMRLEGHKALIHTAAASNLGQMLVKICIEDGVPLVNIVRQQKHVELLHTLGAKHVCNSSLPSFRADLIAAIQATGATVAFDAIGGGQIAGELLSAVETVAASRLPAYSAYGSFERKQVYIYGRLDKSPIVLAGSSHGLVWGVSSWSMPPILEQAGPERAAALRERVLQNLGTTFASRYTRKIALTEVLQREVMLAYCRQATGEKYLITPCA